MRYPDNVTKRAGRELLAIIDRSEQLFGAKQAYRLEGKLLKACRGVSDGLDLCHTRSDLMFKAPTRFIAVGVIMIAYNPKTRQVVRIFDGRRDFARLFS